MRTNKNIIKCLALGIILAVGITYTLQAQTVTILKKNVTIGKGCGAYVGPFTVQVEKDDIVRVKTVGDFTVPWPGLPAYDNQPGAWFSYNKVADPLFQAQLGKQQNIQLGDYKTKTRAIDKWEFQASKAGTIYVYILDIAQWGGNATIKITRERLLRIAPELLEDNDTVMGRLPKMVSPDMIQLTP